MRKWATCIVIFVAVEVSTVVGDGSAEVFIPIVALEMLKVVLFLFLQRQIEKIASHVKQLVCLVEDGSTGIAEVKVEEAKILTRAHKPFNLGSIAGLQFNQRQPEQRGRWHVRRERRCVVVVCHGLHLFST